MILQEEFRKNGYKDILTGGIALEYGIKLEDIYDAEQKPEELLNIFISDPGDELFFFWMEIRKGLIPYAIFGMIEFGCL